MDSAKLPIVLAAAQNYLCPLMMRWTLLCAVEEQPYRLYTGKMGLCGTGLACYLAE
jgi:hypothetical protein